MAPSFRNVSLLPGSGWSPPVCRSGWARNSSRAGLVTSAYAAKDDVEHIVGVRACWVREV